MPALPIAEQVAGQCEHERKRQVRIAEVQSAIFRHARPVDRQLAAIDVGEGEGVGIVSAQQRVAGVDLILDRVPPGTPDGDGNAAERFEIEFVKDVAIEIEDLVGDRDRSRGVVGPEPLHPEHLTSNPVEQPVAIDVGLKVPRQH